MKGLPVLQPICCVSDAKPLSRDAAAALASYFKALADPTRIAIVNRLTGADEVCVCDLTAAFDLCQPAVSHPLKVLPEAGHLFFHEEPERSAQLIGDFVTA